MQGNKKIRWGIIGCGNVTELKSGPAFNKVSSSVLMAVMRRDLDKLKSYAERHQVPYYFTDADALILHPEVDAVYIATPPKFHESYALAAIAQGKPVYVEKPMANDVAACKRMAAAAEKKGVKLVVAHYRRALPLFLEVKRLLAKQAIGKIQSVQISFHKSATGNLDASKNWRLDPAIAGAGYFYDLAPHQLDLVFYFFGKALSYEGSSKNQAGLYAAEDTVWGTMELEQQIQFKGDWCFCVEPGKEKDLFEIIGENGKISFPVFGHTIELLCNQQKQIIHFEPPMHNQQQMIQKTVDYFLENGENPCTAADAIQTMEIMEAFVYGKNKD